MNDQHEADDLARPKGQRLLITNRIDDAIEVAETWWKLGDVPEAYGYRARMVVHEVLGVLRDVLPAFREARAALSDEVNRGIERDAKIGDVLRELCPDLVDASIVPTHDLVRDVVGKLIAGRAKWRAAANALAPMISAALATTTNMLTEAKDAVVAVAALRAERDELAAEVAAYQGRPEGGLPGWIRGTYNDQPAWLRVLRNGQTLYVYQDGSEWCWTLCVPGGYGTASTPRAAMRKAEAAREARGWPL